MVLNIMEEGKIHLTTQSNIVFIKGKEKHLKQTCMTSQCDYFPLSLHIGSIRDFINPCISFMVCTNLSK